MRRWPLVINISDWHFDRSGQWRKQAAFTHPRGHHRQLVAVLLAAAKCCHNPTKLNQNVEEQPKQVVGGYHPTGEAFPWSDLCCLLLREKESTELETKVKVQPEPMRSPGGFILHGAVCDRSKAGLCSYASLNQHPRNTILRRGKMWRPSGPQQVYSLPLNWTHTAQLHWRFHFISIDTILLFFME